MFNLVFLDGAIEQTFGLGSITFRRNGPDEEYTRPGMYWRFTWRTDGLTIEQLDAYLVVQGERLHCGGEREAATMDVIGDRHWRDSRTFHAIAAAWCQGLAEGRERERRQHVERRRKKARELADRQSFVDAIHDDPEDHGD